MADEVRNVLRSINLDALHQNFVQQKIDTIDICKSLDHRQLSSLGLVTVGDQVRFKNAVQHWTTSTVTNTTTERNSLFTRARQGTQVGRPRKQRTWTGNIMCLSNINQSKTPNSAEKERLFKAGLGLKKICFNVDATEKVVYDQIMKEFPQLSHCGGFELLRCSSSCRTLERLTCSWDVKTLRSIVGPACRFYVRPLQRCIEVKDLPDTTELHLQTTCERCGHLFVVNKMRDHLETCQDTSESQSIDSTDVIIDNQLPVVVVFHNQNYDQNAELPDIVVQSDSNTIQNHREETENTELPVDIVVQSDSNTIQNHREETENAELPVDIVVQSDSNTIQNHREETESIQIVLKWCKEYCLSNNISNPIEILKLFQSKVVTGRPLEVTEETAATSIYGETNFILVDRDDILKTSIDEIALITDMRKCLEVQFYGECATDYGGPRKEFFSLVLQQIKEEFFDPVRDFSDDYEAVGRIMALSTLQNGRLPRVMSAELVEKVFQGIPPTDKYLIDLRKGLDSLGLVQLVQDLPSVIHLFTPCQSNPLTLKMLTQLLKPQFSDEGSNKRLRENSTYAMFVKYLREVASGRRGALNLGSILRFATGTEEEPALGFALQPSIHFAESVNLLPTANTCINKMTLPLAGETNTLPSQDDLFNLFDLAFCNTYFGLE